jgi:hypothetical protein
MKQTCLLVIGIMTVTAITCSQKQEETKGQIYMRPIPADTTAASSKHRFPMPILVKESPIVSDKSGIYRSEALGISFQYDENEKVESSYALQLKRDGKIILWIEVCDVETYAYQIRREHPVDTAKFMVKILTGLYRSSGGPDGQSTTELDSILEFKNPAGLRILISYGTEVIEDWSSGKTETTYEKPAPEYFIDLTGLKTVVYRTSDPQNPVRFIQRPKIITLRWEGPSSLYEQRMRRLINSIVPF